MIEKIARQAGAFAESMLSKQFLAGAARGQIQRILVAHFAGQRELQHERFQSGDRLQAGQISARCPFEAVYLRELAERAVDFPEQHRGRGRRAAAARNFAIDDQDSQTLAREALGDQRAGNPGADDQRIALQVLRYLGPRLRPCRGEPGRTSATKIRLFGVIGTQDVNRDTWLSLDDPEFGGARSQAAASARRAIGWLPGLLAGFSTGPRPGSLGLGANFAFGADFL